MISQGVTYPTCIELSQQPCMLIVLKNLYHCIDGMKPVAENEIQDNNKKVK